MAITGTGMGMGSVAWGRKIENYATMGYGKKKIQQYRPNILY
jgi:hypothetical protein